MRLLSSTNINIGHFSRSLLLKYIKRSRAHHTFVVYQAPLQHGPVPGRHRRDVVRRRPGADGDVVAPGELHPLGTELQRGTGGTDEGQPARHGCAGTARLGPATCPLPAPWPTFRAWQALLANSSARISNPRFLSQMASYDVASNICTVIGRRRVIDTHFEHSFIQSHGII